MVQAREPDDFVAQRNHWIIIKNKNYDRLREDTNGWQNFQDIVYSDDDAENVKRGYESLGAEMADIQILENLSFE